MGEWGHHKLNFSDTNPSPIQTLLAIKTPVGSDST